MTPLPVPEEERPDNGHVWIEREGIKWPFCKLCGLIKRADGTSNPCKGKVRIKLR